MKGLKLFLLTGLAFVWTFSLIGCSAQTQQHDDSTLQLQQQLTAAEGHAQAVPSRIRLTDKAHTELAPGSPQPQTPTAIVVPPPSPTMMPAPPSSPSPSSPAASVRSKKPSIPVQRQQEMSQKKLTLSELRSKYSDYFKVNGQSSVKKIALTFDDGPDQLYTPQILDILKANNVKATFFLVGRRAEANPAVVARIVREGHIIGNHSYNHPLFTKLTLGEFQNQIEKTSQILHGQIGYYPKLIRPPYGEITEEQLKWVGSRNYVIVNWNIDSLDWKGLSADQVSHNIISHMRAGAIVLQHSAGGDKQDLSGTVTALPSIIRKIKEDGYELVTVPQLLNLSKQL